MGERDKEIRVMLSVLVRGVLVVASEFPCKVDTARRVYILLLLLCKWPCMSVWCTCGIHQRQQQQQSESRSFFSISFYLKKNEISFRLVFIFPKYFFFVLDKKTPSCFFLFLYYNTQTLLCISPWDSLGLYVYFSRVQYIQIRCWPCKWPGLFPTPARITGSASALYGY